MCIRDSNSGAGALGVDSDNAAANGDEYVARAVGSEYAGAEYFKPVTVRGSWLD